MNKKLFYLAPAALLALASCSQEEMSNGNLNADGLTHFTVKLPKSMTTRDFGNGLTAEKLMIAVYDATSGTLVLEDEADFAGQISTEVGLNLVTNKQYNVAFFAASEVALEGDGDEVAAVYDWDPSNGTMTVDYTAMNSANLIADDYDCFFKYETEIIGGSLNNSVTLTRPVAQICWGTSELQNDDINNTVITNEFGDEFGYMLTNFTATLPNVLNIQSGDIDGTQTFNVNLEDFKAPFSLGYPVAGYNYVATQFVLAPVSQSGTYNLVLNIDNAGHPSGSSTLSENIVLDVPGAPLQANYQTLIYGALLTDNTTFTVTKQNTWGPNNDQQFNIGYPATEPAKNAAGQYVIASQENLQWMANELMDPTQHFDGVEFVLQGDLELTGEWTPLAPGHVADEDGQYPQDNSLVRSFAGTFDGQGYTITGLTVNGVSDCGLFGYVFGGTIKNLNIDGASITGYEWLGVVAGRMSEGTIENCNVTNSSVFAIQNTTGEPLPTGVVPGTEAGIIVGQVVANSQPADSYTISGCNVTDCSVSGTSYLGGIAGVIYSATTTINGCEVNGLTVNYSGANTSSDTSNENVMPGLYGGLLSGATSSQVTDSTAEDVTVNENIKVATSQSELASAVSTPDASIYLAAGNYSLPSGVAQGVTIQGDTNTVFTVNASMPGGYDGVTFEGVKFETGTPPAQGYPGLQHSQNLTYKNCVFEGIFFNFSIGLTFDGCTFNQTGNNYCVWTYTATDVTFTNCTFNCDGKAVLMYNENTSGTFDATFDGCTFTANMPQDGSGDGDGKAAIQINGGHPGGNTTVFDVTITNCTATGFSSNTASGNGLWSCKSGVYGTVTVNSDVVYQYPEN